MPYMRIWRWQLAITIFRGIEPNLEFLVGTLAKIDQDLYLRDQSHKDMAKDLASAKFSDLITVQGAIGMSCLWVLGAYEVVRTLDQRFRELGAAAAQRQSATANLKHQFERLRIPLAKLEPSNRHRATDYAFPTSGIEDERGIAWEVAPGVVISRSQLSDEFLALLESLQQGALVN